MAKTEYVFGKSSEAPRMRLSRSSQATTSPPEGSFEEQRASRLRHVSEAIERTQHALRNPRGDTTVEYTDVWGHDQEIEVTPQLLRGMERVKTNLALDLHTSGPTGKELLRDEYEPPHNTEQLNLHTAAAVVRSQRKPVSSMTELPNTQTVRE